MGVVTTTASNVTDDLQNRNDCNTNTAEENPLEQSILDLWSAQICYRDLMRTRDKQFCRESKLNHGIRFAPRHNLSEDQIREMKEE